MKTNSHSRPVRRRRAFTLVEMVATIGILGLMGIFVVQTIDVVRKTTERSEGMLDAASEARLALDRIGLDLAGMFIRKDMDYEFQNLAYNDAADDIMRFYSEVFTRHASSAISDESVRLSVVGYRMIQDDDNKLALYRGSRGISYFESLTGDNFMGLKPLTGTDNFDVVSLWTVDATLAGTANYDLLSPGVFRLEIALIDSDGNLVDVAPTASLHGGAATTDIEDIAYLIVGIAVLSPEARIKATSSHVNALASALPAVTASQPTPFEAWAGYIDGSTSFPTAVPIAIANNVRFFQRAYPISDR